MLAAALEHITPAWFGKPKQAPLGLFFSVLFSVSLFSLSILVYISWLSGDNELETISQKMAWLIFASTLVISFFYVGEFRLKLFLLGAATMAAIFAYGYFMLDPGEDDTLRYTTATAPYWWMTGGFVHPGWLQGLVADAHAGQPTPVRVVDARYAWTMLALAAFALGMLYTSRLDRRMVMGVFVVGWIGAHALLL